MAAYVGGDQSAFRALFERHVPRLIGVMRRQVGNEEAARDVVQQTFLNLHRARRDFRAGAKLRPWLYTIAFNLARDRGRRKLRRPETLLAPEDQERIARTEPRAMGALRDGEVRAALGRLPEAQREVIVLHWYEGFEFAEIGEIVGASRSAVKVRAHRGYKRLRELLADQRVTDREGAS